VGCGGATDVRMHAHANKHTRTHDHMRARMPLDHPPSKVTHIQSFPQETIQHPTGSNKFTDLRAADESDRGQPKAVSPYRLHRRLRHRRVVGQTEVVVGAVCEWGGGQDDITMMSREKGGPPFPEQEGSRGANQPKAEESAGAARGRLRAATASVKSCEQLRQAGEAQGGVGC
jgi:hypothetical protein